MAQQVVIAGAMFEDVPSISVPDANNVYHPFLDTTIASNAAAASDIAQGKLAYVNGTLVTGTASGGGSDRFVKIATKSLGTISTSSTSESNTGQTLVIEAPDYSAYDMLIAVCHTSPHVNGRHVATAKTVALSAANTLTTKTATYMPSFAMHWKLSSSGTLVMRSGSTSYGVYIYGATLDTSSTPNKITFSIYQRYNKSSTGTVNGNYILDVYGCNMEDLL